MSQADSDNGPRRALPSPIRPLVVVFVVAAIVRLLVVFVHSGVDFKPVTDGWDYSEIGWRLSQTGVYTFSHDSDKVSAYRAPGWPFVLAAVYKVFGKNYHAARCVLVLMDCVLCCLVYAMTRKLFGERAGWIAGIVAASYPQLFLLCAPMLAEPQFGLLLFAALYLMVGVSDNTGWRRDVAIGALFGVATLTRTILMLLPPAIVLWYGFRLYRRQKWPRALGRGCVVVAVMAAVVVPWTIRNAITMRAFIPVTTMGGNVLLFSNNHRTYYEPEWLGGATNRSNTPQYEPYKNLPEVQRDKACREAAVQWVLDQPVRVVVRSMAAKVLNFFDLRHSPGIVLDLRFYLWLVPYYCVLACSVLAVWLFRSKWPELSFMYVVVVYFAGMTMVFFGYTRMRAPLEPILIALASGTVDWLWTRVVRLAREGQRPE